MRTHSDPWLIRNAEIDGRRGDLRVRGGFIHSIGLGFEPENDEQIIDARGGALIRGLNDHHIHLLALGAALDSVRCGPPDILNEQQLSHALHEAARNTPAGHWLRGVGYHESVAGDLDRCQLDHLGPRRPIRIQHRSGARWILNSEALDQIVPRSSTPGPTPLEKDPGGRPTGRLDRADSWLRQKLPSTPPDLARVSALLSGYGITGCSDATPDNGPETVAIFQRARNRGEWQPHLRIMGKRNLSVSNAQGFSQGAWKILLDENQLPDHTSLIDEIRSVHREGRGLAFHCVTRAELVFAASVLEAAGCTPLDRIEHASIAPPDCIEWLAKLPLTVVTQPNFVHERGDAYLENVEIRDQPWLYRCRGFLEGGVRLAGSTDAPFGDPDPWRAMQSAIDRRTRQGAALGPSEALSPEEALALFTSPLEAPGRRSSRFQPGQSADLCLLARGWAQVRDQMDHQQVAAVWSGGRRVDHPD